MYLKQNERTKNYKDMVSSYYAVITQPYRKLWGDFFHPAIFENPKDNLNTALRKTHERFIKDSKLKKGDRAIDLGCGIGSLSRFISKNAGCTVIGINMSKYQLKIAKKLTKQKATKNVEFKEQDIMHIDKIDDKFDAAFLVDVGCHLPDKEKALRKIFRILNKGGRLIIGDWIQKENISPFEKEILIEPFNNYWSFPYMESLKGYNKIARKIGFRTIMAKDVSKETEKDWEIFYDVAVKEIKSMNFKKMVSYIKNPSVILQGPKFIQIAKNQFYANIFTKICYDAGVFRYGYLVLEKR
jgi:ubiquinone/menaquinone biosynthesis C-methylase UbiE